MSDEEFDFDKVGEQFDSVGIAFDEIAKGIVPIFKSFREQGLNPGDAAVLTIEMLARWTSNVPPPKED